MRRFRPATQQCGLAGGQRTGERDDVVDLLVESYALAIVAFSPPIVKSDRRSQAILGSLEEGDETKVTQGDQHLDRPGIRHWRSCARICTT
jgi:hypothetical protein